MLRCLAFNARSLKNKLPDLHYVLYNSNSSVVCISESWLNNTVTNNMLDPDRKFNIYRCDRPTKGGGGVCVFINRDIQMIEVDIVSSYPLVEGICVDLIGDYRIRIITIYRPGGNTTQDALVMTQICDCLRQFCANDISTVVVGDLNCAKINWDANHAVGDPLQEKLYDTVSELGFQQFVEQPTRGDNILDIVLCNDPMLVADVNQSPPFCTSDHNCITFVLNFSQLEEALNKSQTEHFYNCFNSNSDNLNLVCASYRWAKADWNNMASFLANVNWDLYINRSLNVEECWENFCSVLHFVISQFVPKRQSSKSKPGVFQTKNPKKKYKNSTKKLYPKQIKIQLDKKAALWRKYRLNRTGINMAAYTKMSRNCKFMQEQHAKSAEKNILASGDLGTFYRYVNSKLSSKSGIAPLCVGENKYIFDTKGKAECLSKYFASVCTIDDHNIPVCHRVAPPDARLTTVDFKCTMIYKVMNKLKSSLAAGPDGFPPMLFKKMAKCLASPLSIIYSIFFNKGVLPQIWKKAFVTPVFKNGKSNSVENYRPISLTCVACKVFETILKQHLQDFLQKHNLVSSSQHGFVAKHSTCTNMLESLNDWTINIKNGNFTRVAYIDLAKAFDTVCHSKLLLKLLCNGIEGLVLKNIESFLSDRYQQVVIQGVKSAPEKIISGVPQGSVLGPLLFIIYINDLADVFPPNVVSRYFADDAKLYTEIKTGDDVDKLQFSLDKLSDWAQTWQLSISIKKCCTMDLALGKKSGSYCHNSINGCEISNSTVVKDLGVIFDEKLSFSEHICMIVAKAKQRSFLLFRSFLTKDPQLLLLGYKSYILPILDYCSTVWAPCTKVEVLRLESVQRSFTRRIPGLEFLTYSERLQSLNIVSLELRRLRNDLIFCFKILNGLVAGPPSVYGIVLAERQSRGNGKKLKLQQVRVNVRKNYFGCRICEPWNALPIDTVNATSVSNFKSLLFDCNLQSFLFLKF